MNKNIVKALYKKEILDILRDKKTLLMMIVVPLILYPLIFVAASALTTSMLTASTTNSYSIICEQLADDVNLQSFINQHESEYDYNFIFLSNLTKENPDTGKYEKLSIEDALKSGAVDVGISGEIIDGKEVFYINYYSANEDSSTAASMVVELMNLYKEYTRVAKVEENDLNKDDILYSVSVSSNDISSNEETVGSLFGYIIPFMLITSVLMGAMYPAIDVTAGEKERGTLETLLTMPVNNLELIISKFLATSTIASFAALLNVVSMGLIGAYFYQTIKATSDSLNEFSVAIYIPAILVTLLVTIVFAMFCSAICLLVCIFAKSFKEAQNYSTPIMIVFMFSGLASIIPAIELNTVTSVIPVVNISLLIDDLFSFNFDVSMIFTVIISNVVYCLLAVLFMAKIFSSESVLFSEGTEGIRIIEKRTYLKKGEMPGIGDLILLFCILIIVVLLPGSLLIVQYGLIGLILQQVLIGIIVIAYALYIKTDVKKLFSLKAPNILELVFSVFLWAGFYIIILFTTAILTSIFPDSINDSENLLVELWQGKSFIFVTIATALMPAIFEELAFRGFLLGTLKSKYKIVPSILITGFVFGLYHMSLIKLVVVGILGVVLAYVVYKTESIFCSVLMHFLNNFAAVVIALKPEIIDSYLPIFNNMNFINICILFFISMILILIGIAGINLVGRIKMKPGRISL